MRQAFSALTAAVLLLLALTGSVLATGNGNETVISVTDCPDPVVTITLRVLDADSQDNGVVTYRISSGDTTVVADTTVKTDGNFEATVTHTLRGGDYVVRWDDEAHIDSSFDEKAFEVPACQTPTPTPTATPAPGGGVAPTQGTKPTPPSNAGVAPAQGANARATLPATDTLESTTPAGPTSAFGVVLLLLGISAAAGAVATFRGLPRR